MTPSLGLWRVVHIALVYPLSSHWVGALVHEAKPHGVHSVSEKLFFVELLITLVVALFIKCVCEPPIIVKDNNTESIAINLETDGE